MTVVFANRAVFNQVLKVIYICFGFVLLCSVIARPTFSANEKQNQNQSSVAHFPMLGASCMQLLQFLIGSMLELSSLLVIGRRNCFGHSIENHSI